MTPIELPAIFAVSPGGLSVDFGANTLRQYAALARDLRDDTRTVPDFAYALTRHRLLAAIEKAVSSGVRQKVS